MDTISPSPCPTTLLNIGVGMFTIAGEDAAIACYARILGRELRAEVAFGESGGKRLGRGGASGVDRSCALNSRMGEWQPGGGAIGLEAPDVSIERACVAAIDGVTTAEPMGGEGPVARMFSIADPDGNYIWGV